MRMVGHLPRTPGHPLRVLGHPQRTIMSPLRALGLVQTPKSPSLWPAVTPWSVWWRWASATVSWTRVCWNVSMEIWSLSFRSSCSRRTVIGQLPDMDQPISDLRYQTGEKDWANDHVERRAIVSIWTASGLLCGVWWNFDWLEQKHGMMYILGVKM